MSIMVTEVYDALKEAGASEDKSRKAAEAVASYDSLLGEMRADVATIKGDMVLMKWMMGFVLFFVVGIAIKLFV